MSFRARLTLFFVLIVIVPMVSVAIVLFRLISDNETGKADAGLRSSQQATINLYRQAARSAQGPLRAVSQDRPLAVALQANRRAAATARATTLLAAHRVSRILVLRGKHSFVDVGARDAIAPSSAQLSAKGRTVGELEVSVERAKPFAVFAARTTGDPVVVLSPSGGVLGSTVRVAPAALPQPGSAKAVKAGGARYRAASFRAAGTRGSQLQVVVLQRDSGRTSAVARSRLLAAGILLGFLVLALTFAVAVTRSLQAQIGAFLQAARRLAGGDFSTEVPTTGHDEFAALGAEFNTMSRQLESRLEELRQGRVRLESSLQRIGETFESNLDRDALLEIVVRTAVDGVGAEGGRASARVPGDRRLQERARTGALDGLEAALSEAEAAVVKGEQQRGESEREGVHAIAQALHGADQSLGLMSVARHGRAFIEQDRELLAYLARSAAVSIENVGLHEMVQRQAVTDELTGLYNHRRFQEAMASEVERAKRFEQEMSLVMLDIDNFKSVNDTHGHQQGDLVLAEVARVLRESSREIDSPARYGGEELAVVLPGTDLEGAFNLAERVRHGIEELDLPVPTGDGKLRVTASFGVAARSESADDPRALLAAADAALYEAKRSGKNRTVRAQANRQGSR